MLGRAGELKVAVACLPSGVTAITSSAIMANRMLSTFKSPRLCLMVGIGGGVPSGEHDIRLGDVVVSKPEGISGGVIQYDFGKTVQEGRFVRTGLLNRPPDVLLSAVASIQAKHMLGEETPKHLIEMIARHQKLRATCEYQGADKDQLFEACYDHPAGVPTCAACDINRIISRSARGDDGPSVHYGLIASGNQVMKGRCDAREAAERIERALL